MANVSQFIIEITSTGDGAVAGRISNLQGRMESADRAARTLSSSVGGGLKSAFMSLPGAQFFTNPIVAMSSGIGIVAKLGMQAESTATSFKVLVGDEDKVTKMLDDLNKYADDTIWDRMGTQNAAKTMLGFGVAAENVVGDLKMLGNMAMGDKNKLQQLALAFGQVSSAGKLQGNDLLQLINAGYNPLADIAAITGDKVENVKEKMSKGHPLCQDCQQPSNGQSKGLLGYSNFLLTAILSSMALLQQSGHILRPFLSIRQF